MTIFEKAARYRAEQIKITGTAPEKLRLTDDEYRELHAFIISNERLAFKRGGLNDGKTYLMGMEVVNT